MNFNHMQHGYVTTCPVQCGIKLLIHSQTSTVAPLKFGSGQVMLTISYFIMNVITYPCWAQGWSVLVKGSHYNDIIMGSIASQITSPTIVYSAVFFFGRRSKKTSKLRATGLCAGNLPGTGKFPAQMVSYAENVSIWWRHHAWDQINNKPSLVDWTNGYLVYRRIYV